MNETLNLGSNTLSLPFNTRFIVKVGNNNCELKDTFDVEVVDPVVQILDLYNLFAVRPIRNSTNLCRTCSTNFLTLR